MNFIIDNWYIILGIIAVLVIAGYSVYKFLGLPTKSQIAKIKEWLLYAVVLAEKELGSGTGEIKLRYVYDLFVAKFPTVAKVVSFETFSVWVDVALEKMETILKNNESVLNLVSAKAE